MDDGASPWGPDAVEEPDPQRVELSQRVAAQESRETILRRLVETACAVLEGCTTASVTLVERNRAVTVASTGEPAVDVDQAQYDTGAGPCLRAIRNRKPVFATLHDPRWPLIREAARPPRAGGGALPAAPHR